MGASSSQGTSERQPLRSALPAPTEASFLVSRPRGPSTPGSTGCRSGMPSPRAAGPPRSRSRPGAPRRPRAGPGVRTLPRSVRSSSRRVDDGVRAAGMRTGAAQPNATVSVPGTLVATPAAGTTPGVGSGPVAAGDVHALRRDQPHHGDRPGPHRCRGGPIRPNPGVPTVMPGGEDARPPGPATTTGSGASGFQARPREREPSGSGGGGAEVTGADSTSPRRTLRRRSPPTRPREHRLSIPAHDNVRMRRSGYFRVLLRLGLCATRS